MHPSKTIGAAGSRSVGAGLIFLPFVHPSRCLVHLTVGDEVSDLGEVGIFLLI